MSRPTLLRVLIIGCGNIAGGFDAARDATHPPLTHAGAYTRHGGFQLNACVEPDPVRRAVFTQRWQIEQCFAGVDDLRSRCSPGSFDVISLCSPTALHAAHLEAVLALEPRLIFCEKPVTPTLAQTQSLVTRCAQAGVSLAVNHTRRWSSDLCRLADELRAGQWGKVRSATGTYNKGLLNNGSHLVDMLHMLLGPLQVLHAGLPVADFWPDDPTVPAMLQTDDGIPVQLQTAHAADYAIFELQLITSRAVISIEDGGLIWRVRRVIDSPHFPNYRVLDAGDCRPGDYLQSTRRAVDNLAAHLNLGAALASTGDSALAAQQICDTIHRMAH